MEDRHREAFRGIKAAFTDDLDLADLMASPNIVATMEHGGAFPIFEADLVQVAERIIELSAIVAQNALVAIPEPAERMQDPIVYEPTPEPELSPERKAQIEQARSRAAKQEGSLL